MTLEAASRSAVIGLSMLTSIAILGVVVSAAYQDGRHGPESSEPPLIRVPQLPWKLPPDRLPGAPGSDITGLDRLLPEEGDDPHAVVADRPDELRAAGPVLMPATAVDPLSAAPAVRSEPLAAAIDPLPAASAVRSKPVVAASEPPPAVPAVVNAPSPEPALVATAATAGPASTVEYRVQLLSTTDQAAAERAWDGLATKFGTLLADYRGHIEKAELPAGSVYRVQIGPFDGHAAAEATCAELKRQQATCFVLRVGPRT